MEKIVGYTVADATTKNFDSGKHVVNFKIAENRSVPDGEGGFKQLTRFFECAYWASTAIAPHLTKGKLVVVEGVVGVRAYINTHNSEAIGVLTFNVQSIRMYGGGHKANGENEPVQIPPSEEAPF